MHVVIYDLVFIEWISYVPNSHISLETNGHLNNTACDMVHIIYTIINYSIYMMLSQKQISPAAFFSSSVAIYLGKTVFLPLLMNYSTFVLTMEKIYLLWWLSLVHWGVSCCLDFFSKIFKFPHCSVLIQIFMALF